MSSLPSCCVHKTEATLKAHTLDPSDCANTGKHPKCSQRESPSALWLLSGLTLELSNSSVITLCVCVGVFLSNGRWNTPEAVGINPAQSCWEAEEEKTPSYPNLFGETHHFIHLKINGLTLTKRWLYQPQKTRPLPERSGMKQKCFRAPSAHRDGHTTVT